MTWGWGTSRRKSLVKTQPQEVGPIQACFCSPLAALLCAGMQQQGPQNLFCLWPLSLALGLYSRAPLCPCSPHNPCAPPSMPLPCVLGTFPVVVINTQQKPLQEGKVDLGSQSEGAVCHGGEPVVVGSLSRWSQHICSQETGSDDRLCSAFI